MRWLSSVSLLVVSLFLTVLAAEPPKVVVDRTVVEVGKVRKGEKVKAEFRLRNEGGSVLRILSLTPA